MDLKPLTYNGRDEGIEIALHTTLRPGDDAKNVTMAIQTLFPDAVVDDVATQTFPSEQLISIDVNISPLKYFYNNCVSSRSLILQWMQWARI